MNTTIEKELKDYADRRNQLAGDIINLLKEKEHGLTYERAEKILLNTIEVLQKVSRRQEI